jgi:hypothetical protein
VARELPKRIDVVLAHLARTITRKALEQVKNRVGGSGWVADYRAALQTFESSDATQFVVAGYSSAPAANPSAETTLARFNGVTPIDMIMRNYEPWALDVIPVHAEGYRDVLFEPSTVTAVESARGRLKPLLPNIVTELTGAGAEKVVTRPVAVSLNTKGYLDIVWLAKRLETGSGGFTKRPHWVPAANATAKNGLAWGKATAGEVEQILLGGPSSKLTVATTAQLAAFAKTRDV